jgi:hypothetical protein
MELNFSEIDDMATQNPYEQFNENDYELDNNSEKYWEETKSEKEPQTKKKKVSFTDILSNMNFVVNNKGVLQFMKPINDRQDQVYQSQQGHQYDHQQGHQQDHQQPQQGQQQYAKPHQQNQRQDMPQQRQPVDPSVKHSYIYNKYFKDYADVSAPVPEKKVPKTIEEYNQMVYEDRIKRIEERKRITEIKSTKLMFTTTPDNHVSKGNPRNVQASKNSLRKMSFW